MTPPDHRRSEVIFDRRTGMPCAVQLVRILGPAANAMKVQFAIAVDDRDVGRHLRAVDAPFRLVLQ